MAMEQAQQFHSRNDFTNAIPKYRQAVSAIVGDSFEVPLYSAEGGGYRSQKYISFDMPKRYMLMKAFNGIGECLMKLGRDAEVFDYNSTSFPYYSLTRSMATGDHP